MSARVGVDCVLARNTGTYGTPVWNVIQDTRDVTLNLTTDEADATTRGMGYKARLATLKDGSVDVDIVANTASDDYPVLRDGWLNKTVFDLAIADGPLATSGTQYFRGDHQLFGFSRKEGLTDAVLVTCPFKLTYSANPPQFVTVP